MPFTRADKHAALESALKELRDAAPGKRINFPFTRTEAYAAFDALLAVEQSTALRNARVGAVDGAGSGLAGMTNAQKKMFVGAALDVIREKGLL